jgi:hypothetical protein
MNRALVREIAERRAHGATLLTVPQFAARFAALGYTLDRDLDCRSTARYLDDNRTYPCCTTGLKESDTGMSAFHFQARRDSRFREMMELRSDIFAISRGAILEV